jgi:hypothetical protein
MNLVMFNKLAKLFKEPEQGTVKLSFIALDEDDVPYEDVATMPYHDEYIQKDIEAKFRKFMLLRKHLVVEVTILEVVKTSG